jgi:copper chaperone NosL
MKVSFTIFVLVSLFCLASCSTDPQPINYGKDACVFCKMNIVDEKFATQCFNTKGKSFRFDDIYCLDLFLQQGKLAKDDLSAVYFSDYNKKGHWLKSEEAFLLQSDALDSPMGGNTIALSSEQERTDAMTRFNGTKLLWKDINPFEKK